MNMPAPELIHIDETLYLEQLQVEDAEEVFALTEKDRAYLSEFMPWPSFTKTVADSQTFIELMLQRRKDDQEYGYGVKLDGAIIGHTSLMHLRDGERQEIGYWVASEHAGKGITTKVAGALSTLAFEELGVPRVIIRADPRNIGSNRVAEKLGYTLEGQEPKDGKVLNVWSKSA